MPSPTTAEEFLDLVRRSGVIEDRRLDAHVQKLRADGGLPADPTALAVQLVQDGVLTHFQAEQFLQGKWRRFTIGKYKVLERLGSGGMGSVYLCEHKLMRRRVAVKVLPTAKAEDAASLERFYREARAVAALDHPNIVRAYDIDQDDKLHFLVMEHVDGSSLQEIVKKTGPMDVTRAAHYVRQAALGLHHAHEAAGLVHRDIKPSNILVDRNGVVKVLDMGLARFFHDEEDILTRKYDENVLGTADYLAPEQALDSHGVDIRADIYSLGATFYFCLTGRTPFAEGTVAQKLIWHQTRQPKSLRLLRPDVPEGVTAVIERMMAKDAAGRYATPQEVADALAPFTQTPIPPPPDSEMPRFSPAIRGPGAPTEVIASNGPRTPSTSPSPAPRKAWQVPGAAQALSDSPTPRTATPSQRQDTVPTLQTPPPVQVVPGPPPRDLRKSNPPPAPPPRDLRKSNPPPPAPPPAPAAGANGVRRPAPQPARAPDPVTAVTHHPPAWEELTRESAGPPNRLRAGAAPPRRLSGKRRVPAFAALSPRARVLLVVIASAGGVILLLLLGLILWFAFGSSRPATQAPAAPQRPTFFVGKQTKPNTFPTLAFAVAHARATAKLGARIVVQDDLAEDEVLVIGLHNISIEADEGRRITWRPGTNPQTQKLLMLSNAEGFRLKGITLDGEGRAEALINLSLHCPGLVLEDLTLKGFTKYGVRITNCEGGPGDKRISLLRLKLMTAQPTQAALFFEALENIPKVLKDRYFLVRDCSFDGPGAKVQAAKLSDIDPEKIELPRGVSVREGK
jgi:eukaryotic-like serine/threonine-protein kinase